MDQRWNDGSIAALGRGGQIQLGAGNRARSLCERNDQVVLGDDTLVVRIGRDLEKENAIEAP